MYVFIIANSPGEIFGWVRPVVKKVREKIKDVRVILVIPPCQYASGREADVAKDFPGVRYVVRPGQYLKYIFLGKSFPFYAEAKKQGGVCVFLGGDPFHALLISRRLKFPAVAYLQRPRWNNRFKKFMVLSEKVKKDNFLSQGIDSDKVVVVGDLMIDSVVYQIEEEGIFNSPFPQGEPVISIVPGSRPYITVNMTLFFLKACELIKERLPRAHFFLILSPFVKEEKLFTLDKAKVNKIMNVPKTKLIRENTRWKLLTSKGIEVDIITRKRYSVMQLSTLVLTIPGTNTAELAYLGTPMVVTIPFQRPEFIPLEGIAGLIGGIPWVGMQIKKWAVRRYSKLIKFCSLPNIYAGREIVPELRGEVTPQDVASSALEILQDEKRLSFISSELKKTMGKPGAAERVAEVILQEGRVSRNEVR